MMTERDAEEALNVMALVAKARDDSIRRLDAAIAAATDAICRRAGGTYDDPSPQDVRDIFAAVGLAFVFTDARSHVGLLGYIDRIAASEFQLIDIKENGT